MDSLLALFTTKNIPIVVIVLVLAALIYDKRKDRKNKGGSKRNGNFKRPNTLQINWDKPIGPERFKTGDNNICGQLRDGTIITGMGDMNTADGLNGSDTVFYRMAHVNAPPQKIWAGGGKCNSVFCEGDIPFAIKTEKGSNWQGTQDPAIWRIDQKKKVSNSLYAIPGMTRLDVFPTFARHGWGNEWADNRMLLFTVNANKEKFDDYIAGIDVFVGDRNEFLNMSKYRKAGKLLDRQGNAVRGKRNGHMNYIQVTWDNTFGTYILWVSDFFAKTFELWYWDRPSAQDNITRGWTRFYRAPSADGKTWNRTFSKLSLPKSKLVGWQGDQYWSGFWGFNPIRDKLAGAMLASGGWGGPNSPFDRGIFQPARIV